MLLAAVDSPGRPRAGPLSARSRRGHAPAILRGNGRQDGGASVQPYELACFAVVGSLSPGNDTLVLGEATLGHYIVFATAVTRCLWLAQVDFAEIRPHFPLELVEAGALKDLDHEIAAGLQVRSREVQRDLGKAHAARLVDDIDAGQIGRHVAD